MLRSYPSSLLRNHAAYCGITGFRPSPGAVPSEVRMLGFSPLSVNGPMAPTVEDTALLFGVMADSDARDPYACPRPADREEQAVDLATLRVAISEDLGFAPIDHGIRATFRRAVEKIRHVFASAEDRDPDMRGADEAFEGVRAVSFLAAHAETYRTRKDVLGPNIVANIEQALRMSTEDVARAMRLQTEICRRFTEFMTPYDALICPAMSVPPFPHEQLYVSHINGEPLRTYFHWLALPDLAALTRPG